MGEGPGSQSGSRTPAEGVARDVAAAANVIDGPNLSQIVIVTDSAPVRTGAAWANWYGQAEVKVLTRRRLSPESLAGATDRMTVIRFGDAGQLAGELHRLALPTPLVDATLDAAGETSHDRLLLHLAGDPSCVVVVAPRESQFLVTRRIDPSSPEGARAGRPPAAGTVRKLYDDETDGVLTARYAEQWGQTLRVLPGLTVTSKATVSTNIPARAKSFPHDMSPPDLRLRCYRNVVCAPRQLAVLGDFALPNSFHQHRHPHLKSRSPYVRNVDDRRLELRVAQEDAEPLSGAYYHLDSEFPWHFGHFITQDIAKLWGWPEAKRRSPELKVLLSAVDPATGTPGGGVQPHQLAMLGAYGVRPDEIVCIDRPVRVSELYAATSMFYQRRFVHPDLEAIWSTLRENLRRRDAAPRPRRIFVSRRGGRQRRCQNEDQLEEFFARRGFTVVHPEALPIDEQVALFAGAEAVAGCGGSGMFNTIYCERPGLRIVFGSDTYRARNEYTISALRGDDYHHFFCPAESDAFHADFRFDFERDGSQLEAVLASGS